MKRSVREFYDLASPDFLEIWGAHLHDGYYERGDESPQEAQEALLRFVVRRAGIEARSRVLDVGCGMGGTALWLARTQGCEVTGITNSAVQIELAKQQSAGLPVRFIDMDAESFTLGERFDVVLLVGVLGHLHDQAGFLRRARELLVPEGRLVVLDWLAAPGAPAVDFGPLQEGMLMPRIHTLEEHADAVRSGGLSVLAAEDLTSHTKPSWGVPLSVLARRAFWRLARKLRGRLWPLLRAVRAMGRAIRRGELMYGFLLAERPRS